MRNKYLKRSALLSLMSFVIIAYVLLSQDFVFYNLDNNTVRVKQFYQEEKNSLDIVLLGASEVYTGFSPSMAYKDYGFTSYPFVLGANPASLYTSELKEILTTQMPQLIVVEINGFIYPDDKMLSNEEKIRRYVDNIPMSQNRIESILEVDYEDKMSCLIPFIKYHGISTDLKTVKDNFINRMNVLNQNSKLKGISTYTKASDVSSGIIDVSKDSNTLPLTQKSEEYLIGFMDYCKSQGLNNVVFVRFPHPIKEGVESYDCFARSNTVEKMVTASGFRYIGYDKKIQDIGLDYKTDFYDESHLNIYGQQKMTEYFAADLMQRFQIVPKQQSEKNVQLWGESVKYTEGYFQEMDKRIKANAEDWPYEDDELVNILESQCQ